MRRVRIGSAIGLILTLAAFVTGGFLSVHWRLPRDCYLKIEGGTLAAGYSLGLSNGGAVWGIITERSEFPALGACAWRPFRAAWLCGSAIVFPLWQPLVILAGIFAYSHGYLRGFRRSDPSQCVDCGYALRGLPQSDGVRVCPECGRRQVVAAGG